MPAIRDEIEIRLTGEGIRPGLVRSHELAEILQAIEDFVVAEALRRAPESKRDDIVVGLYEVADHSLGLRFKTSIASIAVPAFVAASGAIASGEFGKLSPFSTKPLQVLAAFTKRHNALAEFKIPNEPNPLAIITSDTVIPEQPRISGSTELAARVLRVGGKVPRAMLELTDGTVIYCAVPVQIAIELGHRLYELVTFAGTGTWNAGTLELDEFSISGFVPFPERDPLQTFNELRLLIGRDIEKLGAVDDLVSRLRRAGDEE